MTTGSPESKTDLHSSEDTLSESLDSLGIELSRISAEILSINSGFQVQMQQVLADVRENMETQYREQFEQARLELRAKLEKEIRESSGKQGELLAKAKKEIERVCQQMDSIDKEIAAMLEDSNTELAKVIRKRADLAELRSYLNGLRFSIGETT
jgi:hypothetical protein